MPSDAQLIAQNRKPDFQNETQDFEVRFSDPGETGEIEGRAVTFNTVDSYRSEFAPEAFAGTENRSIPMLWSHDRTQVIGSWHSLQIRQDGLIAKGKLNLDVSKAREVRSLLKAGDVRGLSIGFAVVKDEMRSGIRRITKADLHEISVVTFPAVPGSVVSAVRTTEENPMPEAPNLETAINEIRAQQTSALAGVTERLSAIETRLNRPNGGTENRNEPSAERRAFQVYLRRGSAASEDEIRALTESNDAQGGYIAPPEFSNEFIRNLVEFSPIRGLASVRQTASSSVKYPTRTAITNATWAGETEDAGGSQPAFGQIEVTPREINTYVDISNQLLADSGAAAEAEVQLALSEDFGKKEATAFLKGDGLKQPLGILNHASVQYTASGNANTLGSAPADLLIEFYYSLPATYRGRGTWLMNGKSLAAIRKFKDTTNAYLWQPAYAAGAPETILGRPVVECIDLADIAAGNEPIVFGDIATAYRIVDRQQLSILVNPYLLASTGITRIHATRRVGGTVVQPAAVRKIRIAAS